MAENIRPYIIINGKNSMEVSGLLITKLPPITKPQMRVTAEEIDGRDGDIVTELGFSAYDKEIEIGLAGDYDVNDVIEYFNQSGIITFSNEPDKYYKFAQYDGIDFDKLIRFKKAKVSFHVQPFKFETDENDDVIYAPTSFNVTNEGNIYSRPEIALQGSGNVGIVLNGSQALSINLGETKQAIVIDSNDMNAYGTKSNIKELITEINPVQDLHGYNQPWVGGAGKNKLQVTMASSTSQGITATVYDDGTVLLNGTSTGLLILTLNNTLTLNGNYILSGCPSGGSASTFRMDCYWTGQGALIDAGNGVAISPNGNVLTVRIVVMEGVTLNNQLFKPMICLASEPNPDYAHYEPYSNICPISGWNGCVITRCGMNIWDGDFESGKFNISTGAEVSDSNFIRSKNFIKVKPDTVGYVKFDNPQFIALFYDENKTYTTHYSALGSGGGYISIPSDAHYMKFYSQESTNQNDISINYPTDTDEDYHAYVGSKYQTYFEGLIAGTYGFVDLGSLTWTKLTGYPEFRASYSANNIPVGKNQPENVKSNLICTIYPAMSTSETYRGANTGVSLTNLYISVGDDTYSDADAFTEAMSGKYLIYELASSSTPSITQEDINMLISAFNADLVCVVFGQEVYGGSLNVSTGLLTITHISVLLNSLPNLTRAETPISGVYRWRLSLQSYSSVSSNMNTGYVSSKLANITADDIFWGRAPDNSIGINTVSLYMRFDSATTVEEFNDLIGDTQLVYELATPITVQLSGEDVMTLIGKNNIMSNTGAISELIYTHAGADVTTSGDIVSFDVDVGDIKDNILKNRLVTGNYDNLRLKIGSNQIGVSGDVDVIVLSNFSRWL